MTRAVVVMLPILLLLPLSVSAGELDGKAIICATDAHSGVEAFQFIDGKADADRIVDTGTDFRLKNFGSTAYTVTRTRVYFWDSTRILDRQTLELKVMAGTYGAGYKCEVMHSAEAYFAELERRIGERRAAAEALMEKNKI